MMNLIIFIYDARTKNDSKRSEKSGFVFLKTCCATVMFPDYENNSHP